MAKSHLKLPADFSSELKAKNKQSFAQNQKLSAKGFTLIELIVVMLIMSIVLSLVGPLTLRMLDRAQAQSELISFKNSISKVSYIAFASATEHSFELNKDQLIVYKANRELQQTKFDYLSFAPQTITFNSRGYPYPETMVIELPNKSEEVNLFKLVEGVDARIEE
ncbi:type II secretion system protein [Shewanella sp. UCD-KL12]|uniref:type II secretion system protein n=1 Tax=Shewanella sp. UCD-KL12 TaxID=1917163 RepID=UPI0009712CF6|nr:type II secretion system protein [Shewanella sp. UCD-KL12]